jgi:hypothetical protein
MRSFDGGFEPGKQYSLILMLDVLEHFARPVACLRRALELLEPQGTLLVTVPAFRCLWTSHDELNHHFTRYTKQSFTRLACEAGMRINDSRYFFFWACPVKLAIRLKEKLFPRYPTVPRLPPHWINETLYQLSRIEHVIFGALPMPFGSSLIVIGGKQ